MIAVYRVFFAVLFTVALPAHGPWTAFIRIGPSFNGVTLLLAAGHIIAFILGLWRVVPIFKSGRL